MCVCEKTFVFNERKKSTRAQRFVCCVLSPLVSFDETKTKKKNILMDEIDVLVTSSGGKLEATSPTVTTKIENNSTVKDFFFVSVCLFSI